MVKILAVDPGLHTGICLLDTDKPLVDNVAEVKSRSWQLEGAGYRDEVKMGEQVLGMVLELEVQVLVIEDFIATRLESSERSGLSAVRVTMAIDCSLSRVFDELYGERMTVLDGCVQLPGMGGIRGGVMRKMQMPGMKETFDDVKLKRLGLWKGLTAHQRDAWRHALTAAKSAGLLDMKGAWKY